MDASAASHFVPTPPNTVSGTGSRVTVVCAECKRLKLRCDRRTPCGACVKRDTVSRCIYSPAAAEKIDLQSLHNRILTLESTVQALTTSGLRKAPSDEYERTVLATGPSGSSIVVSLEDVASIWLDELDVLKDIDLRIVPPDYAEQTVTMAFPQMDLFVDPALPGEGPCVTQRLIGLLPDEATRDQLLRNLESTMLMHPSFNFPHFKRRIDALFDPELFALGSPDSEVNDIPERMGRRDPRNTGLDSRPSLAFFSAAVGGLALGARTACTPPGMNPSSPPSSQSPGTADSGLRTRSGAADQSPPQLSGGPESGTSAPLRYSPDSLFMLSKQALAVTEFNHNYDLDFITAVILNGLFLLHDGKLRVAHTIYPTVGKLVNICKMMGLHLDPDEFPGKYSLFDAEARRRAWWDVYYYDSFMSDCMGQDPLIDDEMCTTRLPADVDEENFHPGCKSLPKPREKSNFSYFIQKCRLARLIKTMRRRWVAEQPTMEMWLEAAQEFEAEVTGWLSELPPRFRLSPTGPPPDQPENPFIVAQRCELAAMANSLIIKAYTPLLKRHPFRPQQLPSREAQYACSNAAHVIVQASQGIFKAFGQSRPASYVFYSFGRQIFAAAAVSANLVIQAPTAVTAEPAMRDLVAALELMRNPFVSSTRGQGLDSSALPNESLHVVELLHAKADEALRNGVPLVGSGRRQGVDGEYIPLGFNLPFMGSSLATSPGAPKVESLNADHSASIARLGSPTRGSLARGRLRSSTIGSRKGQELDDRGSTRSRFSPGTGGPASSRAPSIAGETTEAPPAPPSVHGSKTPRERKSRKSSGYPSIGIRARTKASSTATHSIAGESAASSSSTSTHHSNPQSDMNTHAGGSTPVPPPPPGGSVGPITVNQMPNVGPQNVPVSSPFRPPMPLSSGHDNASRSQALTVPSMERRDSLGSSGPDSVGYAIPIDRPYNHPGAPRRMYTTEYLMSAPSTSSSPGSGYFPPPPPYGNGTPTQSPFSHSTNVGPHEVLGIAMPGGSYQSSELPVSPHDPNPSFASIGPLSHTPIPPAVHHYPNPPLDVQSNVGPPIRGSRDSFNFSPPGSTPPEDQPMRYNDVDMKPPISSSYGYESVSEGNASGLRLGESDSGRSQAGPRTNSSPSQDQQQSTFSGASISRSSPYGNGMQPPQVGGPLPWSEHSPQTPYHNAPWTNYGI